MHDLSLHILDLIENSLQAQATKVAITVILDEKEDTLRVIAEDNGPGFQATSGCLFNPFFTTRGSKRVGLGLSLFKSAAELAGGQVRLSQSREWGGALVEATMVLRHVDRPPLGDLASTISGMVLVNPKVDFELKMVSPRRTFTFGMKDFVAQNGLDRNANVELAYAVFTAIRSEVEAWRQEEVLL